jgi:hypothetical protein
MPANTIIQRLRSLNSWSSRGKEVEGVDEINGEQKEGDSDCPLHHLVHPLRNDRSKTESGQTENDYHQPMPEDIEQRQLEVGEESPKLVGLCGSLIFGGGGTCHVENGCDVVDVDSMAQPKR